MNFEKNIPYASGAIYRWLTIFFKYFVHLHIMTIVQILILLICLNSPQPPTLPAQIKSIFAGFRANDAIVKLKKDYFRLKHSLEQHCLLLFNFSIAERSRKRRRIGDMSEQPMPSEESRQFL